LISIDLCSAIPAVCTENMVRIGPGGSGHTGHTQAPYVIAVVPEVGYGLCEIAEAKQPAAATTVPRYGRTPLSFNLVWAKVHSKWVLPMFTSVDAQSLARDPFRFSMLLIFGPLALAANMRCIVGHRDCPPNLLLLACFRKAAPKPLGVGCILILRWQEDESALQAR
jgi:hypothetical protein